MINLSGTQSPDNLQFMTQTISSAELDSVTIAFKSQNANLDTITLTEVSTAVPEPASLVLLGMGLLGLAATRRRV